MDIVHVITTLNVGGAEHFVVQLANEQAKHYAVGLMILAKTDDHQHYLNRVAPAIKMVQLKWRKKYSVKQFFQFYKQISRWRPRVVHAHLHNPFYYVFALSFFRRNTTYVHTIHSSFQNWEKTLRRIDKLRFLSNRILHICLAETILKDMNKAFPKLRFQVIGNGINPHFPQRDAGAIKRFWNSFPKPPKEGNRLLAIGNICGHKNYKLLALSLRSLAPTYPGLMCVQVGGQIQADLALELAEINSPNLFMAGPMENAADFLTQADALIISSRQEGMPIVALEALSMGVPVITTPVGGMPDIVNDRNGLISESLQVTSFKRTIEVFLKMPMAHKKALGKGAQKAFLDHYEIGVVQHKYRRSYGLE